jgi:general secretion pathway protein I
MSRGETGFTLVEVVVAFVIVTLTLAGIYHAIAGAYRGEARALVRDQALAHARAHLETIGVSQPLELGETTGTYVTGMAWRLTVAPTDTPAYKAQAFRIVLEPLEENGQPFLRLETFKLVPRTN